MREAAQNTFAFAHVPWTAWAGLSYNYYNSAIRINSFPLVLFVTEHCKVSLILRIALLGFILFCFLTLQILI
jgi:hypothetical protein